MKTLLPTFLSLIPPQQQQQGYTTKLVDLGCGTGRNTVALLLAAPQAQIIGLEPSSKMLDVARRRVAAVNPTQKVAGEKQDTQPQLAVSLQTYNILETPAPPAEALNADGVISTLVLEHVPLDKFFQSVSRILKPGGVLLLTNMHSEMGGISQAGFVHPDSGVKIRPTSYAHTIPEVVEGAERAGFEVLEGGIKEVGVDEELAKVLGPRARKWIGLQVWFGGCFRKK